MSSNTAINKCSACHKNLPVSLFVRNQRTNTSYKTCITCRNKRNDRRQNLRRQISVAAPPSLNDTGLIDNDITMDIINPQPLDNEIEASSREIEISMLNVNANHPAVTGELILCSRCRRNHESSLFTGKIPGRIYKTCCSCRSRNSNQIPQPLNMEANSLTSHIVVSTNIKHCTRCKKNFPLNMFSGTTDNSTFATCNDCRTQRHNERFPSIYAPRLTEMNPVNPFEMTEDIYDVSDNEVDNLGLPVTHPVNQDVVGEEALADDEPVIFTSHTDTREYAAHMRAREALPEDHDDIFNNLPVDNLDHDTVDTFEIPNNIYDNHLNPTSTNLDTYPRSIHATTRLFEEESLLLPIESENNQVQAIPTTTRRLPLWLASLPTHRTIPAAYTSKYTSNLPVHDLGRCNSVCPSCHALHWPQERIHSSSVARPRFQTCCKEGQVVLNEIPEPPAYLRWLWTSEDRDAKAFRSNSRAYNRSFAFTSFNYTRDNRLADMGIHGGLRSFSIHGQIFHQTGAVLREGAVPRYAQLYFVGSERAVEARTDGNSLNPDIVRRLTELIEQSNPFVEHYHTALRSLQESEEEGSLRVVLNPDFRLVVEAHTDRRRYNLPTADEVAVVIPDGTDRNTRDVILFARNGDGTLSERFEYIPRNHPAYLPLHYVLFYPLGNPGYHWSIPLQNQRVRGDIHQQEGEQEGGRVGCVSARQFYRYHLFTRQTPGLTSRFNALIHGGKLFQQICCDMYACIDDNILNWHRLNQSTVRADLYSGVMDALRSDRADQIGDPVILAASYVGGDRFIARCYQNAMAIARVLGNPSLFITFTANPSWSEVSAELEHGQSPDSRPDLIGKVFKLKLDQLLHDIKERNVCGVCIGSVYTIEYQKRGLPHAHILLFLHRDVVPRCAEQVDELVRAQIPVNDPELATIVKSLLVHGPCGPEFPNAPCMRDGRCSKHFPKKFCDQTTMLENSYPEYERPDNGVRWGGERFLFDNRWVVPHNPYLTKKYKAHINVEIAGGVRALKYLAKYVYKGSDRATLAVPGQHDEIEMTLQGRYIGPVQAIWRLLAYATHEEKPAVMQLPFHLAGRNRVSFSTTMTDDQIEMAVQSQSSPFLDWMKFNEANEDGRDLLYSDFPMHFTYIKRQGWRVRRKGHTIGRLPVAVPRQGEHFYLRSLLTVKRGARSYRDLYTVHGTQYTTPSAACRAMGLTFDDSEWISMFNEIKDTATARLLRIQFAEILAHSEVLDPQNIWELYKDNFSDDCLHRITRLGDQLLTPPEEWTDDERRYDYALFLFGICLQDLGLDWERARLIRNRHNWVVQEHNQLIAEALSYDRDVERDFYLDSQRSFSSGQRAAFDMIRNTIDNNLRPNTFFLQGPAGTGKTFLYKTLCSLYRSQGKIVLCVASSGIASLLLPNGSTAHSLFKIPLDCTEDSICRVPGQSNLAKLLRQTALIIWDEVTMQLKHNFSAVDRLLRDVCKGEGEVASTELFGGIPVLLGGDFAQILPVVPRGRREQIVDASISCWHSWHLVKPLFLTQNMRVIEGEENQRFANWLSQLPYNPSMYGSMDIPEWIQTTDDRVFFREFVYSTVSLQSRDTAMFHDRTILSSTNDAVERFNDEIAELRTEASREYFSHDEVRSQEAGNIDDYTPEYLREITCQGVPKGILKLQIGMPVMLLRNYYPRLGLCNGSRLIITKLYNRCVKGKIISQDPRFNGKEHFISRVSLTIDDKLPFPMVRKQLPLRPCFSMTINKSQGQTLKVVGVDLTTPVFSHGQFYVAMSRVTDIRKLIVLLPPRTRTTKNIVYDNVLLRPPP